ncbi:hypothetical protein BDZ97DRAFT_1919975 [Flammula alnicola]|nr:hypothetical protein BDZ97DRAFT_1919975 [Flammula alnicola]
MSTIPALPHIDISSTFGAALIGALISTMLYGLTTLQTYLFYVYYPKDSRKTKTLVALIWILDTLHAAFMSFTIYHYLVANYFNPAALAIGHWSLFLTVALNTVIACTVQCFFTIRIAQLCHPKLRWWVTSIIGAMVLAHFAFGAETVIFMQVQLLLCWSLSLKYKPSQLFAATPFAVFAVLSDVMIAGALCYLLSGSRTGFRQTDTLVSTLIIYAINRCLLTSVVAVVEVIVFATMPHALWYVAIDFFIGKLYANSLLATLNSRVALRTANTPTFNSIHLSGMEFNDSSRGSDTTWVIQKNDRRDLVLELRPGSSSQRNEASQHTDDMNGMEGSRTKVFAS